MTISKSSIKWAYEEVNIRKVLALYQLNSNFLTTAQIAKKLDAYLPNVQRILRNNIPADFYKYLKSLRFSRAKQGCKNPNWRR